MTEKANKYGRRRGRGIRPWFLMAKLIGLFCFIGGLSAAAALTLGAPEPRDWGQWRLLADCLHWLVIPGMVGGGILTILAGLCLWLQMPRVFLRMRWFKVKMILVVALVPAFHFWGNINSHILAEVLDKPARIDEAGPIWSRMGSIFLLAFVAMLLIAYLGRIKPRLGQPIGPPAKKGSAQGGSSGPQ